MTKLNFTAGNDNAKLSDFNTQEQLLIEKWKPAAGDTGISSLLGRPLITLHDILEHAKLAEAQLAEVPKDTKGNTSPNVVTNSIWNEYYENCRKRKAAIADIKNRMRQVRASKKEAIAQHELQLSELKTQLLALEATSIPRPSKDN